MTQLAWYAIATPSLKENLAMAGLRKRRLIADARLPIGLRPVRLSRFTAKTRMRALPLMAGYVFAAFAPEQMLTGADGRLEPPWRSIEALHFVRSFVRFGEKPLQLNRAFGGRLLKPGEDWETKLDYSGVILPGADENEVLRRRRGWDKDDTVELVEGPFAGQRGKVISVDEHGAAVLLEIFCRTLELPIPARAAVLVERAPPPKAKRRRFEIGDMVRVLDGPFASFEGPVDSINGKKITVTLQIFGRQNPTVLEAAQLTRSTSVPLDG